MWDSLKKKRKTTLCVCLWQLCDSLIFKRSDIWVWLIAQLTENVSAIIFNDHVISSVIFQAKIHKVCRLNLLKCEDLLLFLAFNDSK